MPQPSSAGWKLSETNPSTDQVLTKVPTGFASRPAWVSRSAMCTPLTPSACISRAQPARSAGAAAGAPVSAAIRNSASFRSHDTMPGFAPQQLTAVVPPGCARASARTASRSA